MKAFHEVRSYSTDLMVWHKAYENISFLAHWHKEIELLYIKKGSIKMHVTNHSFTAYEGDLVICDTGDIHYSNSYEKGSVLDFLIFDTSLISNHYQYRYFESPVIRKKDMESFHLTEMLFSLENTIDRELDRREEYYKEIITSQLRNFWFHLLRSIPMSDSLSTMGSRRITMLGDFQTLLSYMEEHTSEGITLEKAAEMMHFSPSHFCKVFKDLAGIGFVKYMNILRVTQASEQLLNSNQTITQIAYNCGFQNMRTFNRVFKEITGYTPSEYVSIPEHITQNFTYYKSNSNLVSYAEKDPVTISNSKDSDFDE